MTSFLPSRDPMEVHRVHFAGKLLPRRGVQGLLDAGCGDGYFCEAIRSKRRIPKVAGVDVSAKRVAGASERCPDVDFRQGSAYELPFADASFDAVTCIEVLEHLEDPGRALRELARVARRWVVITVPDREELSEVLCPHCLKRFPRSGHIHSFDGKRLAELGGAAGLALERTRVYEAGPGTARGLPLWLTDITTAVYRTLFPRKGNFLGARYRRA